jgi:hypothetical protein
MAMNQINALVAGISPEADSMHLVKSIRLDRTVEAEAAYRSTQIALKRYSGLPGTNPG